MNSFENIFKYFSYTCICYIDMNGFIRIFFPWPIILKNSIYVAFWTFEKGADDGTHRESQSPDVSFVILDKKQL